jgi:hypothetical protein
VGGQLRDRIQNAREVSGFYVRWPTIHLSLRCIQPGD